MPYTDYTWITDRLALGGWIAEPEELPFDAILSMETHAPLALREWVSSGRVEYRWYSIVDIDSGEDHDEIVRRFEAAAALINEWIATGRKRVLVHCYAGISRSVTAVVWYLVRYEGLTWDEALETIKARRPMVYPNVAFEIPLRLVAGELLTEDWLEERLAGFCDWIEAQFHVKVEPRQIRERLEEQGTVKHIGASVS